MANSDTIVAPATPPGESALALVRISGPLAAALAAAWHGGSPPPPRFAWHADYRDRHGAVLDDVIFTLFARPQSYTGEDVLEISLHGNPFILRRLLEDLLARGCRLAEPGEFTRRAFLNGRLDLTAAEAVMDVIRARSERALQAAQQQLRGSLGRRIDELVTNLLSCCAAIEAHIDFPEDDLPIEDRTRRRDEIAALRAAISRLQATRRHGELLRQGLRVVLLGAPNAGKSSLLNRLAGYERAIVSVEPGTTRDFLEEPLSLGPHCIRIIDTAGLRTATAAVERAGVERSLEQAREADLVVLVVDAGAPCPTLPAEILAALTPGRALIAVNKCDQPERQFRWSAETALPLVEVSALTGAGCHALQARLIELADALTGIGADEERLTVNARHAAALAEADSALDHADQLLATQGPLELVGSELRTAVAALGAIVGRIDHEQILDRLFASFCIGK